ncbi:MAG: helix-hairpin-helix domain-containing protein [Planctomycetota bacterium]
MRLRPAPRTYAYLLLWLFLAGILLWRRLPELPVTVEPAEREPAPFQIDLNHDPWQQLTLIAGIGETLARRIVTVREVQGPFQSLEQVMAIPGVPDPVLEAARPWLSLGPQDGPGQP